jgi:hypothetical protein
MSLFFPSASDGMKTLGLLILAASVVVISNAHAATLTWNITGTFDDSGTITGSFTFDADTNTIGTWSITTSGGDTATFPDITYDSATNPGGSFFNNFLFPEEGFVFADPMSARRLILLTTAALTDAGGSIPLVHFIDGTQFSGECYNCSPARFLSGTLTAGPSTLPSADAPEPASAALIVTGAAMLILRCCRPPIRARGRGADC